MVSDNKSLALGVERGPAILLREKVSRYKMLQSRTL